MNNRDQHIVNSLRRWIHGDISQKEESQLDREAGEDLFLQEALEGYRSFPEGDHLLRLDRIRQQLPTKSQKQRGLLLSLPYQIAAAAVVVLTVSLFWLFNPGSPNELAEAEQLQHVEESPGAIPPPVAEEAARTGELRQLTIEPNSPQTPNEIKEVETRDREANSGTRQAESVVLQESPSPKTVIDPAKKDKTVGVELANNSSRITTFAETNPAPPPPPPPGGNSLAGEGKREPANIPLPDSGEFVSGNLEKPTSAAALTTAEEQSAQKKQKNKVNPAVTGSPTDGDLAQPVGGYKRFERYLNRNLRYPEAARNQNISGTVNISFTIQPDGSVINVRVTQSQGAGLDEEAIRLLKEGPNWKINNGGQESISFIYQLKFSL